jgi:hypothetical protein
MGPSKPAGLLNTTSYILIPITLPVRRNTKNAQWVSFSGFAAWGNQQYKKVEDFEESNAFICCCTINPVADGSARLDCSNAHVPMVAR